MLTRPTEFQSQQNNTGAVRHIIVKLVSGGTTWLFSDIDMNLTDGYVYPLLPKDRSGISITQSIDPYRRTWKLSTVAINLLNADYLGTGAMLSDEWDDILNGVVTVYLAAGSNVTSLSDCLVRFIGIVITPPTINSDYIRLSVIDKSKINIVDLPQTLLGQEISSTPVENRDKLIPIVYGDFIKTFDATTDTGLAVALLYDWVEQYPATVVADHALNAITKIFAKVSGLPEPIQYLSATLTASSALAIVANLTARAYLYPVGNFIGDTSEDSIGTNRICKIVKTFDTVTDIGSGKIRFTASASPSGLAIGEYVTISGTTNYNGEYVVVGSAGAGTLFDVTATFVATESGSYTSQVASYTTASPLVSNQDDSDKATVKERLDGTASGIFAQGLVSLDNYATGNNIDNQIGEITDLNAEIKVTLGASVAVAYGSNVELAMIWGPDDADRSALGTISTLNGTTFNSINITSGNLIAWHWLNGYESVRVADKEYPVVLIVQMSAAAGSPTEDSIPGNQDIFYIHELRVRADFTIVAKPDTFFVACEGREYGSWITGRSSSYAASDMIKDPAGIIESILRDEIGLVDADIDMPSFIAAESAIESRANYHSGNTKDSNSAIRELVEQSTFMFFYSSANKAKLIDLSDTTPTTAARGSHPVIFPYSHIKGKSLRYYKEPKLYNDITYKSRWQQEYGKYRDSNNVVDSTSVTAHGTRTYKAEWKNINGTSAAAVAAFLVGTDGIWSNRHNIIEFTSLGYTGADVEIGDWIELSSDIDPHLKLYGTSWAGKQFLVISLTQLEDTTKLTAIELF